MWPLFPGPADPGSGVMCSLLWGWGSHLGVPARPASPANTWLALLGLHLSLAVSRQDLGDPRCPWLGPLLWVTQRGPGFLPSPPPRVGAEQKLHQFQPGVAWVPGLCGVGACVALPPVRGWAVLVPQDSRRPEVDGGHDWLPSKVSGGGIGRSLGQCPQRACALGMGPRSFRSDLWLLCVARCAVE